MILPYWTPNPLNPTGLAKHLVKSVLTYFNGTLSCGLFGPEIHGYTVDKLSYNLSVKIIFSFAL